MPIKITPFKEKSGTTQANGVENSGPQQNSVEDSRQISRRKFIQNSSGTLFLAGAASQFIPASAIASPTCLPEAETNEQALQEKPEDIAERYRRAEALEQGVFTKKLAFNTIVYPHWIGESDTFWYMRDTKTGGNYRLVNAKTGSNHTAFNHRKLAAALAQASGQKVDPDNLPIADVDITLSPRTVSFAAFNENWVYDEQKKRCKKVSVYPKEWKVSPDGKKAVFIRDYNLWIKDLASGREKALTRDGERFNAYANVSTVNGTPGRITLEAIWSPDSRSLFTHITDTRKVNTVPPLVEHVPADGSFRPRLVEPERRKAFPGDEHIEAHQFLAIDVESGQIQLADYRPSPVFFPDYTGFFTGNRGWWNKDSRRAYYLDAEPGGRVARLLEFDTRTGKVRALIEEISETPINLIPSSHLCTLLLPLPESNELIWYSERSGWAHLYLYDLNTGTLKRPVTQGEWLVRSVLRLDTERRELFIQTAGREVGRNPYYCDICRVQIDTGKLTTIRSSDHHYIVQDQTSRISYSDASAQGVSPGGRYVVTTRSRVDEPPVTLLLDRNGRELFTVQAADLFLPKGWQWPEPVMLKAADGHTDICGVVFRPSDFSPDKSYPVLDCSYGGLMPIGSFANNLAGNWLYFAASAYAELGFIAVMIIGRGGNLRSRAFTADKDPVLSIFNPRQEDAVAGIKQLAQRYPYMDLDRVGVGGFGTTTNAINGLFRHPDFYKVGVSINAQADRRAFGAYNQLEDNGPQLDAYAGNLRGKLLLMNGMMSEAVPVFPTFRVVQALQQANKTFDMLLLPNDGLNISSYGKSRAWDYFVRHLQGVEPPKDFKLTSGVEYYMQEMARQQAAAEQAEVDP